MRSTETKLINKKDSSNVAVVKFALNILPLSRLTKAQSECGITVKTPPSQSEVVEIRLAAVAFVCNAASQLKDPLT